MNPYGELVAALGGQAPNRTEPKKKKLTFKPKRASASSESSDADYMKSSMDEFTYQQPKNEMRSSSDIEAVRSMEPSKRKQAENLMLRTR